MIDNFGCFSEVYHRNRRMLCLKPIQFVIDVYRIDSYYFWILFHIVNIVVFLIKKSNHQRLGSALSKYWSLFLKISY